MKMALQMMKLSVRAGIVSAAKGWKLEAENRAREATWAHNYLSTEGMASKQASKMSDVRADLEDRTAGLDADEELEKIKHMSVEEFTKYNAEKEAKAGEGNKGGPFQFPLMMGLGSIVEIIPRYHHLGSV